jgi:hypothetical protein
MPFAAVRLVHPTGESVVPLRGSREHQHAWSEGVPRCSTCREADGANADVAVADREAMSRAVSGRLASVLGDIQTFAAMRALFAE